MSFKSLLSLPTEITENILSYLTNYEVNTLGMIGNEHLKGITDAFVKRRGIYFTNFINKLHLNFKGTFSSIVHFSSNSPPQEDILIAVGYSSYYDLIFGTDGSNCIEYLVMNALFRSNPWRVCKDKIPSTVSDYQVNIYENKLILTGGYNCDDREYSNQVLEGSITFEKSELRVSWTLLKPMHEKRFNHVAAVIGDCLYCLGGEEDEDKDDLKSTEYYSFKSKEWKRGLNLQCCLSQAKGVVDQALKLCFIIGGVRDGVRSPQVSLFNPFEGLLDIEGDIDITSYNEITAVLL